MAAVMSFFVSPAVSTEVMGPVCSSIQNQTFSKNLCDFGVSKCLVSEERFERTHKNRFLKALSMRGA